MQQLSLCRDLNQSVIHSLWYDPVLAVYAIFGRPGEPVVWEKDEQTAWKRYQTHMKVGTNV